MDETCDLRIGEAAGCGIGDCRHDGGIESVEIEGYETAALRRYVIEGGSQAVVVNLSRRDELGAPTFGVADFRFACRADTAAANLNDAFDVIPNRGLLISTGALGVSQYDYRDLLKVKKLSTIPIN